MNLFIFYFSGIDLFAYLIPSFSFFLKKRFKNSRDSEIRDKLTNRKLCK